MEKWRKVPGYENYEVSTTGKVRNINFKGTGRIRMLGTEEVGPYLRVALSRNNKRKKVLVHCLVAQAYIPNPRGLKQVNHKDENPHNNSVDNLEWCDAVYNSNYGTRNMRIAEKLRKPVYQYSLSGELIRKWDDIKTASKVFNNTHISSCCRGERLTAAGYKWTY